MIRTILVTGGCGYLGSQLLQALASDERFTEATVRILDNLQSGEHRALMDLPGSTRFQFIEGDLLDPAAVRVALKQVDTVIHLAALVRTPLSFENPAWMEQVNHWGTAHLVDAALDANVERFIYASSTAVYGPGGPYTEMDNCRPQGSYARTKFLAEQSVRTALDRGMSGVILRFATLFGQAPVLRFDAVFNRFAYLAGIRQPLPIYGNGDQLRPYIHVRDGADAILLSLSEATELAGHVVNVVAGNVSVAELANAIQQRYPDVRLRFTEQDIRTRFSFQVADSILSRTGWMPQLDLITGLDEIIERFRGFEPAIPPAGLD